MSLTEAGETANVSGCDLCPHQTDSFRLLIYNGTSFGPLDTKGITFLIRRLPLCTLSHTHTRTTKQTHTHTASGQSLLATALRLLERKGGEN